MTCPRRPLRIAAAVGRQAAAIVSILGATVPAAAEPVADYGKPMSALARMVARQGGVTIPSYVQGPSYAAGTGIAPDVLPPRRTASRDAPDVFGSVALPVVRTALDARWRHAAQGGAIGGAAGALAASLRNASRAEQAAAVNAWVNARTTFTADRAGPNGDDWAPAARTLRTRRGDCEDYAIAKLALLRGMGVAAGDLYLVVAYDLVRRQDHAMLVVRAGDALLLLDSATDRVLDATRASDYRPLLSFSAGRAWVHGYARQRTAPRYAAIDPVRPKAS